MTIPKELFCDFMFLAYKIQEAHPDWSMDKCIEHAVKGWHNGIDLKTNNLAEAKP